VAQIIFSTDLDLQTRSDKYKFAIADLVNERQSAGKHVMAVDMSTPLTRSDLADKKHPNDSGYKKMARAWYDASVKAKDAGWIKTPVEPADGGIGIGIGTGIGIGGGGTCEGSNWIKQGQVADLVRIWAPQGQVSPGVVGATRDRLVGICGY